MAYRILVSLYDIKSLNFFSSKNDECQASTLCTALKLRYRALTDWKFETKFPCKRPRLLNFMGQEGTIF